MTWSQYQRACLGYRVRIDRGWDYTRNLMAAQLNTFAGKGSRKIKPSDIYACVFDRQIEPMIISKEEWQRIKKAWNIKTKYDA